jgi:Recombinase/Recombinase zinc beta ribbon domain
VGLNWTAEGKIEPDPDQRVRQALGLVFEKFTALSSARQVRMWFLREGIGLPVRIAEGTGSKLCFQTPAYSAIGSLLRNPLYAGAYAWGKTTSRTVLVSGRARRTAGHAKPQREWTVLIVDHHAGYISWEQFERNQAKLAENTNMKSRMKRRAGRGGQSLLAGLLRCGRCGRMLEVVYGGKQGNVPRYQCQGEKGHLGPSRCLFFSGVGVDRAVGGRFCGRWTRARSKLRCRQRRESRSKTSSVRRQSPWSWSKRAMRRDWRRASMRRWIRTIATKRT